LFVAESVFGFHVHFPPVPYGGAGVVGTSVSVTDRRALFLVGGQLRRSRSAQPVRAMRVALISSRRFICQHLVCNFIIATATDTKAIRQNSLHWDSDVVVRTTCCMTSNQHVLVFAHGPAPAPVNACMAIQCEGQLPDALRSMLIEVVVGTLVNS